MSQAATFPTFCHISEYGDEGYSNLHRMLAISWPLILWAPSSAGILGAASQIDGKAFVRYVEDGLIRIYAREQWLTDRRFRSEHRFAGARWNDSIDGALKSIYEQDLGERDELRRRVVAAPPETGWAMADAFLAERPSQVDRWYRIFRSRRAMEKLPIGIIERTRRELDKARSRRDAPLTVARTILRDAFNHSEAFRLAGAEVPFLLTPADRQFLELIKQADGTRHVRPPTSDLIATELTHQLLEVLRHLDVRRGPTGVDRFIRGEGHSMLAAWLQTTCERLRRTDAKAIDNAVIAELREQLRGSTLSSPLREALTHRLSSGAAAAGAVGVACSVVELVLGTADPTTMVGFAASVFALGVGMARQFQYVPTAFDGPQWPFLYTYGAAANRRRLLDLRYVLGQFRR